MVATADYSGTTSVAGLYGPTGVGGYASGQFQFVTIENYTGTGSSSASNAGGVVVATQGQGGVKVLGNKPQQGDPCQLFDLGEVKVVAGAALTVGQIVMSDANGRAVAWVNDGSNVPVGEVRTPASQANDICTIFISPNFAGESGLAQGYTDGLTAHAGGTQAAAIQLGYGWNRLSTVATLGDSAALPAAVQGAEVIVVNDGAAAADIYAKNGSTDTIDGVAGSTAAAVTNAKRSIFICITTGAWLSLGASKSA
ncbi:MAG: hypothetical protein KGL39_03250 [Patescibacteria group bacterium]|nr:hypothetical protein [Patescibacteria group bacterium]